MANDEHSLPLDSTLVDHQVHPPKTMDGLRPPAPTDLNGDLRPYRPARRHRDDRRVTGALTHGWDCLGEIEPDNLSWPEARQS